MEDLSALPQKLAPEIGSFYVRINSQLHKLLDDFTQSSIAKVPNVIDCKR